MDHSRFNSEKNWQADDSIESNDSLGFESSEKAMNEVSITDWVHQIGLGFQNICQRHNIEIEMDLDEVRDATADAPVKDAVIAMVNNAIESMPNGGDLEINLVDGMHQWEIEVADSGEAKSSFPRDQRHDASSTLPADEPGQGGSDLPMIESVELNRHLAQLEKLTLVLGATRQSWNCPLGGTAEVLIVPKKLYPKTSNANSTTLESDELATNQLSLPNSNPDQRKAA